jgi:hypothetical protein
MVASQTARDWSGTSFPSVCMSRPLYRAHFSQAVQLLCAMQLTSFRFSPILMSRQLPHQMPEASPHRQKVFCPVTFCLHMQHVEATETACETGWQLLTTGSSCVTGMDRAHTATARHTRVNACKIAAALIPAEVARCAGLAAISMHCRAIDLVLFAPNRPGLVQAQALPVAHIIAFAAQHTRQLRKGCLRKQASSAANHDAILLSHKVSSQCFGMSISGTGGGGVQGGKADDRVAWQGAPTRCHTAPACLAAP